MVDLSDEQIEGMRMWDRDPAVFQERSRPIWAMLVRTALDELQDLRAAHRAGSERVRSVVRDAMKQAHSIEARTELATVRDSRTVATVSIHLTEDERKRLTGLCEELEEMERSAIHRCEGPEAQTRAAEHAALRKLMYLPAVGVMLSEDDLRLLRGIRKCAASWQQSHAERLLLDRLLRGGV